jgi:hypothetical protein
MSLLEAKNWLFGIVADSSQAVPGPLTQIF